MGWRSFIHSVFPVLALQLLAKESPSSGVVWVLRSIVRLTAVRALHEPLAALAPALPVSLFGSGQPGGSCASRPRRVPAVCLLVVSVSALLAAPLCPFPKLPQLCALAGLEGRKVLKLPGNPFAKGTWPRALVLIPEGSSAFLLCLQGLLAGAELLLQLRRAGAGPFAAEWLWLIAATAAAWGGQDDAAAAGTALLPLHRTCIGGWDCTELAPWVLCVPMELVWKVLCWHLEPVWDVVLLFLLLSLLCSLLDAFEEWEAAGMVPEAGKGLVGVDVVA